MGYFEIGRILGAIAGVLTFVGAYIYCIASYGFLLGLGFGWLPSGILAAAAGAGVTLLWGPLLFLILLVIIALFRN